MNSSAARLLRTLDTLGVQSVRFRVLSHGSSFRHTSPVAVSDLSSPPAAVKSAVSVPELFAAYSLAPRKGEYVLNVETGSLALLAAVKTAAAKPAFNRVASFKRARLKLKKNARQRKNSKVRSASRLAA